MLPGKISLSILFAFAFFFSGKVSAQMEFVENKGQWHSNINFKGEFRTGALFLEKNGFTMLLHKAADMEKLSEMMHGHGTGGKEKIPYSPVTVNSYAYKMKLLGASSAGIEPEKPFPTYNNYYIGDPSSWKSGCKLYQTITYKNIYPRIDIRYYSDAGFVKYDFIIHPGGNPGAIAMQYDGVKNIQVKNKELVISTPVGEVREKDPYSYFTRSGQTVPVDVKYIVKDNVVTFQVKDYDLKSTLVIDPSIIFSTFSGSSADNWGYTATPGPDGTFFAGGITFGQGYPVSPGAYQTVFNGGISEGSIGGYDVTLFKFSANGSTRLYATYLGGSGNEQPHSMISDEQGNLVVTGRTNSADYPRTVTQQGPGGDFDIFITKFNVAGTMITGSVKVGGSAMDGVNIRPKYVGQSGSVSLRRNYGDDARSEVILDDNGNIILVACTQSSNFPVSSSAFQRNFGGGLQDGVILKYTPDLSVNLFSSFFGGNGDDACFSADISPLTGDIYIGGGTGSNNLPGVRPGVISGTYQGGEADGFVTQVRNDGSSIIRTTYQGTSGIDIVYGLKFDKAGFPYIMGTTTGSWRILNATFSSTGGKQFISKLESNLSAYVYSTVFGTNSNLPNISPVAFLVDRCENVYVSGWGGGINVQQNYTTANTSGLPEVNPLPGIPPADGADFYFFVLERNAVRQLFGSHYGQSGGVGDHVDGGTSRFDANGVIYQAMCANCGGDALFPTTPGVWEDNNQSSGGCNQASVKIEMNFAGVGAGVRSAINGVVNKKSGCIPLTVNFSDTLNQGVKFYWNFGDGSPEQITTTNNIDYTFNSIGSYTVRLISEDSTTCNIRDTSYITIRAGDLEANLDFTFRKLLPCESLNMEFTNTSTAGANFSSLSFVWDFGDGTPRQFGGLTPPVTHTYAQPGVYTVTLYLIDTLFCNAPDSISKEIRLTPYVQAAFRPVADGCVPYDAVFINNSDGGTDFIWNFGDGTTSTEVNPTHTYTNTGTYNVTLIAIDTNTCNKRDTSNVMQVSVFANPVASFTWAPDPPVENTPVRFTNTSTGATRYLWNFGDGESSTEVNPVHQFNSTGEFDVELIVFNNANCSDTVSNRVRTIIVPVLGVPNAFTPGKFGEAGVVSVRGFGIGKMDWRIYNRWGQLVFHTQSRKQAWDGTFKGKLQPMDVYVYTLDVEFTDGKKLRKTGDITLIR